MDPLCLEVSSDGEMLCVAAHGHPGGAHRWVNPTEARVYVAHQRDKLLDLLRNAWEAGRMCGECTGFSGGLEGWHDTGCPMLVLFGGRTGKDDPRR